MKTTPRGYQYPEPADMAKNFPSIAATTITKIDADMTTALTRQMTPGPKGDPGGNAAPWQAGTAGTDTYLDTTSGDYVRIRDNGDQTCTLACVMHSNGWDTSDQPVQREVARLPLISEWLTAAAFIVAIDFSTTLLKKAPRALPAAISYGQDGDLSLTVEQPPGTIVREDKSIAFVITLALPA